jgi:hypothetical protein
MWSVVVLSVLVLLVSAFTGDWSISGWYFAALGTILGALCIYGAVVGALCHSALLMFRVWRKIIHGRRNG